MVHFLLFYRILSYSFGSGILLPAIHRYVLTRNSVVKAFLLFWTSMTVTSAGYMIDFYVIKNTGIGVYSFAYIVMQAGALCTSVSLPFFIHELFHVKRRWPIAVFLAICSLLFACVLTPISSAWTQTIVDCIMITVVLSNVYSFVIGTAGVARLRKGKDRTAGFFFLASYIALFTLLLIIDIFPIEKNGGFLIFPLFYVWVGSFFTVFGYGKIGKSGVLPDRIPQEYIARYGLTDREVEVILLLAEGRRYKKIANALFISTNTVNTHVRHIYEKTGTNGRIRLIRSIAEFG